MLDIQYKPDSIIEKYIADRNEDYVIQTQSSEEKVILLILRDLLRLGWEISFKTDRISIQPPQSYNKQTIKESMSIKRHESIKDNLKWIENHIDLAQENLANGIDAWKSDIIPSIEVCKTQDQHNLFRIFRYYWSSPYSEYVGRRIKLIVRDNGLPHKPVIGIAALGSSIVHIPDRDEFIGWDKETRTNNLIYTMDAYVLGALPPYNHLLGGKLVSYIVASNEVREIFRNKYKNVVTKISKRKANDIACIFTTSLYGRSSQYNRMKFHKQLLYQKIGETRGYGTLHLTDETFDAMRNLLIANGVTITNKFGDGPIWRMRVIRSAANLIGFDANFLLRHSFRRSIYVTPLASNYIKFLHGHAECLDYFDYPLESLTEFWHKRWLNNRRKNPLVKETVIKFRKSEFNIG